MEATLLQFSEACFWNTVISYNCNGIIMFFLRAISNNWKYLKFAKLVSISTGIGAAKGILILLRSERMWPEVNVSDHWILSLMSYLKMWSTWSSKIKTKVMLKISLDLKIYFIYTVYSFCMKQILHFNFSCLFCQKNPKLHIADT